MFESTMKCPRRRAPCQRVLEPLVLLLELYELQTSQWRCAALRRRIIITWVHGM
jgi:hypothetical protein